MNETSDHSDNPTWPAGRAWLAGAAAAVAIAALVIAVVGLGVSRPAGTNAEAPPPDCESLGEDHIRSRVDEYLEESWWDDTDYTGDDLEMTLYRLASDRLQPSESACLVQIEWPDSDQFFFSDAVVCMNNDDHFIRLSTQSFLSERSYDEMVQDCLMVLRGYGLAAT